MREDGSDGNEVKRGVNENGEKPGIDARSYMQYEEATQDAKNTQRKNTVLDPLR
jgi:hypothetical protein